MTPFQLVRILQLTDSFFPVGAFAYSDGLESAAAQGRIHDGDSLRGWLNHFLDNVFVPCDGLAFLKCALAMQRGDFNTICSIDEELTAIKPAASIRNSSRSIGKRLSVGHEATCAGSNPLKDIWDALPNCNAPVAYALALTHSGIDERDALLAFGYSRLAGIVSAGMRLIAVGQQQAQALLSETLTSLPVAVERIVQMQGEPLRSFSPLMDIEQMNHRHVYSRLFRS